MFKTRVLNKSIDRHNYVIESSCLEKMYIFLSNYLYLIR